MLEKNGSFFQFLDGEFLATFDLFLGGKLLVSQRCFLEKSISKEKLFMQFSGILESFKKVSPIVFFARKERQSSVFVGLLGLLKFVVSWKNTCARVASLLHKVTGFTLNFVNLPKMLPLLPYSFCQIQNFHGFETDNFQLLVTREKQSWKKFRLQKGLPEYLAIFKCLCK